MTLTTDRLTAAFLAALPAEQRRQMEAHEGLAGRLAELLQGAREAWPRVPLSAETYAAFLAQRMTEDLPPAARLEHLRAADLYLACAGLEGDPEAVRIFEEQHLAQVRGVLGRMRLPQDVQQEALQSLRARLYVAPTGGTPLLAKYSGRGSLRAWMRVTGVHTALKILERGKREVPMDDEQLMGLPSGGTDPELQLLKQTYRAEFREAFRGALASLSARERSLLQLSFLEGLTVDQLGGIFRVHRATAARWLARARALLLERTRAAFTASIGVARPEFESIMRLIDSRLEITFQSLSSPLEPGGVEE
jgi:RNA polymerase sigma-70 factor (ECF subfamily)